MVEIAAQQMLNGQAVDDAQDQMFFTGVWNDAYPAILVRDPLLPDSAKIQLLYLMQAGRANPYGANPLPSVEKTARDLGKSTTTVVRDRAIIRMARWATQCRRVRDAQGRMRGLVWSMHGEPVSLAETTSLDPEYMRLLEQAASGHFDRIARRVANLVLEAIDHDIGEGRDPLGVVDPIERRLEALETIRTGRGRCFAGYFAGKPQISNSKSGADTTKEPVSNFETSVPERKKPVSNFETSTGKLLSNFETGTQTIDSSGTSNFETSVCSSSSSNNKTTTTETDKPNHEESAYTVSAPTLGDGNLLNPYEGAYSVSTPVLHWPPTIDDNRKRLVQRMLQHHLPERHDDHQEVVNALAAKLADKEDPIRNLGYYVKKLCQLAKNGELCPVEPPGLPEQAGSGGRKSRPPDRKVLISRIHSEIKALQDLISNTHGANSAALSSLRNQEAKLRDRLRELQRG